MSANVKVPRTASGGVGASICFLAAEEGKSSSGTLEGADHTAADNLSFATNICLILAKAKERFGSNIRPILKELHQSLPSILANLISPCRFL